MPVLAVFSLTTATPLAHNEVREKEKVGIGTGVRLENQRENVCVCVGRFLIDRACVSC